MHAESDTEYTGWRLRAYPTPEQEAKLLDWSAAGGRFWNDLTAWWRDGMRLMWNPTRDLDRWIHPIWSDPAGQITKDTWVRLAGTSKAPAKPFYREGSPAIPDWQRPDWAADTPARMLHGVGQDFDQTIAAWWGKQRDTTAITAWQNKRIKRGKTPLPKRAFGAPRFQPAGQRLNLRWQCQDPYVLSKIDRRHGALKVVGFASAGLGTLAVHLDSGFPDGAIKSIRLRRDSEGLWWVGLSIKSPTPAFKPARSRSVGLDRGVNIPVAASTGAHLSSLSILDDGTEGRARGRGDRQPGLTIGEQRRLQLLERRIAKIHRTMSPACHEPGKRCTGRCGFGRTIRDPDGTVIVGPSNNLLELRRQVAKLKARQVRRRQQIRHTFTRMIVNNFDTIAMEALNVKGMTGSAAGSADTHGSKVAQKSGLNRSILASGWFEIERQLVYKAKRHRRTVVKVRAAFTSQTCAECGHVDSENRETQERFVCRSCGAVANADVNAATVVEQRIVDPDTVVVVGSLENYRRAIVECGATTCVDTPERIGDEAVEPETVRSGDEAANNPPSTEGRLFTKPGDSMADRDVSGSERSNRQRNAGRRSDPRQHSNPAHGTAARRRGKPSRKERSQTAVSPQVTPHESAEM